MTGEVRLSRRKPVPVGRVVGVHGGIKFYRNTPQAARAYLEQDRSPVDDYYLHEGAGLAERLSATPEGVVDLGPMDGDTYEQWVAGIDIDTGSPKGRLRNDEHGNRFLEVTVNGPKTWSLAAALDPEISAALDAAQDEAAREIVGYLAAHSTTRVGGRGKQVQVPVEKIEAAVIRHYTSRAGDPHRHLHLQVNARVWAQGKWRGIHTVGFREMIEAINGIGHAAVATNPTFRRVLAEHGFTMDPETSEIHQLAPYVGAFSARARQIEANIDRYEATWRKDHPGQEPGPRLREIWDRRAWADARPDKVVPKSGAELIARWNLELRDLGFQNPTTPVQANGVLPGQVNRDAAAAFVVRQLGSKQSAWNPADIRGKVELLLARVDVVAEPAARIDLAEDITARAVELCEPLLASPDVPEHVRSLSSVEVLDVEAELIDLIARRSSVPAKRAVLPRNWGRHLSREQATAAAVLAGDGQLVVVEGAAGAGKTKTLRASRELLGWHHHRLMVVTPTLKAAEVAARETGAQGHSAAWLIHQHGWRWNDDGVWTHNDDAVPSPEAGLGRGDLLVVDEAGMLDQDTARALFLIVEDTGARIALVGDRHQLPAVGRGGVLDHAAAWAHHTAHVSLEQVHRFTDPDYARLTQMMRTGTNPGAVFDDLHRRGLIRVHPSEAERTAALADAGASGALVVADTRDHVRTLNAAIRDRAAEGLPEGEVVVTGTGESIWVGDRVATRHNDAELQVANRQTWTVAGIGDDGGLLLHARGRDQWVPVDYVNQHVELAYATTVYGAQGDTVDHAHFALTHTTGAAATYVAMTRGRHTNTTHIVAATSEDARDQWVTVFSRDRADLGPAHARQRAIERIDQYGPAARRNGLSEPSVRPPSREAAEAPGIGL